MARRIEVDIIGDASSLERSLKRAQGSSSGFGKSLGGLKVGALAAVGGVTTAAVAIKGLIDKATEAEVVQRKMQAQLEAVGIDYAKHADKIDTVITKHSMLAGIDDEKLTESFTVLARVTENVNEALDLNQIAANLSAGRNMDLVKAAELVGKVYKGKTSILGRYGIVLKEGATAEEALAALQRKFAGQAEANATAQAKLGVVWENLQEKLGKKLLPAFERFSDWLIKNMPAIERTITKTFDMIGETVGPLAKTLGQVIKAIAPVIEDLMPVIMAFERVMMSSMFAPIKVIAALLQGDWTAAWNAVKAPFEAFANLVTTVVGPAFDKIKGWIGDVVRLFTELPGKIAGTLANLVSTALTPFQTAFGTAKTFIGSRLDEIRDFFVNLPGKIAGTLAALGSTALQPFREAFGRASDFVTDKLHAIGNWFGSIAGTIAGLVPGIISRALSPFQSAFERAAGVVTGALGGIRSAIEWIADKAGAVLKKGQGAFAAAARILAAALGPLIAALNGILALIEAVKDAFDWLKNPMGGGQRIAPGGGPGGLPAEGVPAQHGGIFTRATRALIGEGRQPEAVIPLSSEGIAKFTRGLSGGGGGGLGQVVVNVHGSVITERDLALAVRDELVRLGRRNAGGVFVGQA